MRLVLLTILLLTAPSLAFAMGDALRAIGMIAGAIIGGPWGAAIMIAITAGSMIYGNAKQRRAARRQRDEYNAGLSDRTITRVATEAPHVYVYGRAKVGSAVVAILTSGDKDQYKHMVCVHAAHECEAIEEIYVAGKPLGPLNANGDVTQGDYYFETTEHAGDSFTAVTGSTYTIPHALVIEGSISAVSNFGEGDVPIDFTYNSATRVVSISGTIFGSMWVSIGWNYIAKHSRVRVRQHLGTPTDPADASLLAEVPSKWASTAVLRGFCYTVVRLDLNEPEFQGGPISVEVQMRGKKLYDFRTGTTAWSQNNALAIYDYLISEMCGVDAADLPMAEFIAAANDCDANYWFGPRYTFNGTVSSDQPQPAVLEKMAQSIAGGIVPTTWSIYAGVYTAPVMALSQSDIVGKLSITPGLSDADIYNGVRGQFTSAETLYAATDFRPYQNAAYVAADGKEMWTDIEFPFTDTTQRVHNICRISTEDQRNGYTVKAEFSLKAWNVKVWQRVTLSSTFFGWNAKVFRVTDRKFAPGSAVELTLKEDDPSIWDFADAVVVDATPNTNLPNPFRNGALSSVTCTSGTNELLVSQDGTIISRIRTVWPQASQVVVANGRIEIEWQRVGSSVWQRFDAKGDDIEAFLSPVEDNAYYVVRGRTVNTYLNVKSDWTYAANHKVIGKTEPPTDVETFSISNGVLSWPAITGVPDLAGYKIRFHYGENTTWSNAVSMHVGVITEAPYRPQLIPPGIVTLMIKAVDTTGNESSNSANIVANLGDPILQNLVLTYDDKAAGFPGEKSGCSVVAGNLLADDSGDLFWSNENAPFFGLNNATHWPIDTYLPLYYALDYIVQPTEVGSRLTLGVAVSAASYNVEFRYGAPGSVWGADANYAFSEDNERYWASPTEWQGWPGSIEAVEESEIGFRITGQGGFVQTVVSELALKFDVEDEFEELDDIAISALGTRLPITKAYRAISNIQLTLQDNGGTAVSAKWADKDETLGPLIYCYNSAGAKVAGVIDARIQGVKG